MWRGRGVCACVGATHTTNTTNAQHATAPDIKPARAASVRRGGLSSNAPSMLSSTGVGRKEHTYAPTVAAKTSHVSKHALGSERRFETRPNVNHGAPAETHTIGRKLPPSPGGALETVEREKLGETRGQNHT